MDYYTSEPPSHIREEPNVLYRVQMNYQRFLDSVTPYPLARWIFTAFTLFAYCCRVYILQGFYVVSYVLGIFLLNRLIGFLSPKIDPDSDPDGSTVLPTITSEDFRPFLRRVSELKFWTSCTIAILLSLFCTLFGFIDLPVFWPILLLYFILLFYMTMKRQIMLDNYYGELIENLQRRITSALDCRLYTPKHMVKHHYMPFTYGKPSHRSRNSQPGFGKF